MREMAENEMFTPWPEPTRAKDSVTWQTLDKRVLQVRTMEFSHLVNVANFLHKKGRHDQEITHEYAWRVWFMAFNDVLSVTRPWTFSNTRLYEDIRNLHTLHMPLDYTEWVIDSFRNKRYRYQTSLGTGAAIATIPSESLTSPTGYLAQEPPKAAPKELDPLDSSSIRFSLLELF